MGTQIRTFFVTAGLVAGLVGAAAPGQANTGRGVVIDLGVAECAQDINGLGVVVTDTSVYRQGRTRPLPGGLDTASRINDHGQIAGSDDGRAALWDGRRVVQIGVADAADTYSYVTGLNAQGDVVGTSGSFGGRTRAFVWSHGVLRVLPDLGGDAGASGINDRGQVVGFVWEGTSTQRAALWEADGTLVLLGALGDGSGHSLTTAINVRGESVGYSYESGGGPMRAVRWSTGQDVEAVDGDGSVFGIASDISNRGRVVGNVVVSGGSQQGFVRDMRGGDLRLVTPLVAGSTSVLSAVNESGTAVGCEFSDDGSARAILFYGSR